MSNFSPLILYHGPECPDGFGAAFAAWLKFKDTAEYVPVNYGDPFPPPGLFANRDVYILDFSYKKDILVGIKTIANSLLVLDHHKTAQADLAGLDFCKFDMAKSGAVMAWEYFFPGQRTPMLFQYLQDHDLWRFKLEQSREVRAVIRSHPKVFLEWFCELFSRPIEELFPEGQAILRFQDQLVAMHCRQAYEVTILGHKVLTTNAGCLMSEIANELAKDRPFGTSWFRGKDKKIHWSLRSIEPYGIDVSEVAKTFGGGGHRNSAGFESSIYEFPTTPPTLQEKKEG